MIRKYRFGKPLETDAVVDKILAEVGNPPYLNTEENKAFTYRMDSDTAIYGLGQQVRGINKRGWLYASNCEDDPVHREDRHSLYAAHNFLVVDGKELFGVFLDYPTVLEFDLGYTDKDEIRIVPKDWNLDVYIIEGKNINDIVKQFRKMIGRSYIPPKWAFGYSQSRWSYMNEDEIREVVRNHRERGIPLDNIYMDIDYMDRYIDFTLSDERFPNFPDFVREMKAQNVHLVPIIDAGVKIEEGNEVYEEGVKNGYFCKTENGENFVGAVWPGLVHFPDFLNPVARDWFGHQYKFLLDQGIEGFWNDMNEPSIFYTQGHFEEVLDTISQLKGKELVQCDKDRLCDLVKNLSNNQEDYQMFYHNFNGEGEMIRHDRVHNLFGYNMTRGAGEAFEKLEPDKRILLISRSSYIGMHRYAGIWQGDNLSWWSHILLNIKMMPSLNMCGILYTGANIGGFGSDTTEDLLMRWMEFGIFTPLMWNHACIDTRYQEPYRFNDIEGFKNIMGIRYGLLPYLYSEYMKAVLRSEMMFRPLAFDYPDDSVAAQVEDQLMLGDGLMLAPVYQQNAKGRSVYLPERMMLVTMRSMTDYDTRIVEKGYHFIPAELNEVIFFIRENHVIPMSKGGCCVADVDFCNLDLLGYVTDQAVYELYDDDGNEKDYENPDHMIVINVTAEGEIIQEGTKKVFSIFK